MFKECLFLVLLLFSTASFSTEFEVVLGMELWEEPLQVMMVKDVSDDQWREFQDNPIDGFFLNKTLNPKNISDNMFNFSYHKNDEEIGHVFLIVFSQVKNSIQILRWQILDEFLQNEKVELWIRKLGREISIKTRIQETPSLEFRLYVEKVDINNKDLESYIHTVNNLYRNLDVSIKHKYKVVNQMLKLLLSNKEQYKNHFFWISRRLYDESVEGLMIALIENDNLKKNLKIDLLMTAPWNMIEFQGKPHEPIKGVGTVLMLQAFNYAKVEKFKGITLNALSHSTNFYKDIFENWQDKGYGRYCPEFLTWKHSFSF